MNKTDKALPFQKSRRTREFMRIFWIQSNTLSKQNHVYINAFYFSWVHLNTLKLSHFISIKKLNYFIEICNYNIIVNSFLRYSIILVNYTKVKKSLLNLKTKIYLTKPLNCVRVVQQIISTFFITYS